MSDPSFDGVPCARCDEGTVTASGEHGESWPEPCDHCGGRGECDCAECHKAHAETHCAKHGITRESDGVCWKCWDETHCDYCGEPCDGGTCDECRDRCEECSGNRVVGAGGAMTDCHACA